MRGVELPDQKNLVLAVGARVWLLVSLDGGRIPSSYRHLGTFLVQKRYL